VAGTVYQLTGDALIARSETEVMIFGRWDRRFGCWRLDENGLRPAQPDGPVLDHRGVWLSPWPDAGAAEVAAYFSLIPLLVRRRAARCRLAQWSALELQWTVTGLGRGDYDRYRGTKDIRKRGAIENASSATRQSMKDIGAWRGGIG